MRRPSPPPTLSVRMAHYVFGLCLLAVTVTTFLQLGGVAAQQVRPKGPPKCMGGKQKTRSRWCAWALPFVLPRGLPAGFMRVFAFTGPRNSQRMLRDLSCLLARSCRHCAMTTSCSSTGRLPMR